MTDLHERFRTLDRVAPPDLWSEVEQRATATALRPLERVSGHPWRLSPRFGRVPLAWRLALIATLLLTAVLAIALIAGRPARSTPLVFTSWEQPGLFAIDSQGGSPRRIFDDFAQRIHLSPDGRYAFLSDRDGHPGIAATDGSSFRRLELPGEDFGEDFGGREFETVWAADSHAVAWISRGTEQPALYVADVVGGSPRRIDLPPPAVPEPGSSRRRPMVWSNDSVHLVYLDWGICLGTWGPPFVVNTESGVVRQLGTGLELIVPPAWSNDGRYLAMLDGCSDAAYRLVVGDTASGATTVVAEGYAQANSTSWSPDDHTIRWTEATGTGRVALRSVASTGGQIREIASLDASEVAWSPDGRYFAWYQPDDGFAESWSLWAADATDGRPRRTATDVAPHRLYSLSMWSPDSAWIAFVRGPTHPRDGGRGGSLWIARPDGSHERLLIDGGTFDLDQSSVDW